MKQTEVGLIPEDWELKRLGEISSNFSYGVGSEAIPFNGIDKYIRITDIDDISSEFTPHPLSSPSFYDNKHIVEKDDILFARTGATVGKSYVYNEKDGRLIFAGFLMRLHINNADSKFVFYNTLSQKYKSWVVSESMRTGQPGLNLEQLKLYSIPLPPLAEQHRIAKALSDVDAVISTTEKLIQKKKNIKQGAMQSLLTGKKRLPGFAATSKFKQTELGEIPEDWEVKALQDIFEFRPNNTFTRDNLNDSEGIYQNIHYGDILIKYPSILDCSKESIPYVNENIQVRYSNYGIKEGDIIIADTAEDETVGKAVEIYNLGDRKLVSGLHTFLCRRITDDFAPRWLGYFMNQSIFHDQLLPFITGTKVSAISRSAIQNLKVLIPSKSEQTAIANVLSSMDKEIETLNTKLEKYRNLKTAMMQQLLTGKIRLR